MTDSTNTNFSWDSSTGDYGKAISDEIDQVILLQIKIKAETNPIRKFFLKFKLKRLWGRILND